ncbi:hypothetical protein AB0945_22255 [Streptomyces sp. NPDC005474]|uniref:hypothetical protein n=1 Tax=Streptomyces sp. NPDC005474 TaxID=3154878 RepID=UPI0034569782
MQNLTSRSLPRPGRRLPRRAARGALLVAVGTTAITVLTACGGGSGGADDSGKAGGGDVASLPSSGTGGGSAKATTNPDAGRPQIRLDNTQDDINRMMEAWTSCLEEKGGSAALLEYKKKEGKTPAGRACQSKLPLDPPELDPAKNPHYNDDMRVMVQCLNSKGFKTEAGEGGWSGDPNDFFSPNYEKAEKACQIKAFGGHN